MSAHSVYADHVISSDRASNRVTRSGRASALPPEDRRAAIRQAAEPLLVEYGDDVTTRQIAHAAGVAEGTVFRAFGDKESLIQSVLEHKLDPEPLRRQLRQLDTAAPLEETLHAVVTVLHDYLGGVMRLRALLWARRENSAFAWSPMTSVLDDILEHYAETLILPPKQVAAVVRMLSLSAAFSGLHNGIDLTPDDLTRIILHGVVNETTTD